MRTKSKLAAVAGLAIGLAGGERGARRDTAIPGNLGWC